MKHIRYKGIINWPTYTPDILWNTLLFVTAERYWNRYGVRLDPKEFG